MTSMPWHDGKVRYPSRSAASTGARRMTKQTGGRFDAYSCVTCGAWHVGHRSRTGKARRRVKLRQRRHAS